VFEESLVDVLFTEKSGFAHFAKTWEAVKTMVSCFTKTLVFFIPVVTPCLAYAQHTDLNFDVAHINNCVYEVIVSKSVDDPIGYPYNDISVGARLARDELDVSPKPSRARPLLPGSYWLTLTAVVGL
jgi:hypothetical protein